MSYYSETQYKPKENLWFESLYFDRWFRDTPAPILDVGCATGNFIATHPDKIEGVELDKDCLAACRARGFKVRALDASQELNQLPEDYYSGIYAKQIIEHLNDPLRFLKQLRRALAPGGKLVVLTPNCPYMLDRFWDDYTHVRPLTKASLMRLALNAGFTDFRIYEDFRCLNGLGFLMRTFHLSPAFISRIQHLLFMPGLSLVLEARK